MTCLAQDHHTHRASSRLTRWTITETSVHYSPVHPKPPGVPLLLHPMNRKALVRTCPPQPGPRFHLRPRCQASNDPLFIPKFARIPYIGISVSENSIYETVRKGVGAGFRP